MNFNVKTKKKWENAYPFSRQKFRHMVANIYG